MSTLMSKSLGECGVWDRKQEETVLLKYSKDCFKYLCALVDTKWASSDSGKEDSVALLPFNPYSSSSHRPH